MIPVFSLQLMPLTFEILIFIKENFFPWFQWTIRLLKDIGEWSIEWQGVVEEMTTSGKTNGNEWQRVITNDNE